MKKPTIEELKAEFKRLGYIWPETAQLVAVRSKANIPNKFDDLLGYVIDNNVVWHTGTTNPGTKPLKAPSHPEGVAVVCAGQYVDAWKFGFHKGRYLCMKQCGPVNYQRDNDRDETAESYGTIRNDIRGFNWHRANEHAESQNVENWSEGCMVRNNPAMYDEFIQHIKNYLSGKFAIKSKYTIDDLPAMKFTGTILNEWL